MPPQHEAHESTGWIDRGAELRIDARVSGRRPGLAAVKAPVPLAAVAAQEVNARIAAVAETLTVNGDDASYTFFCECGCLQPVPLTLSAYAAAAGALRAGHGLDG